MFEKVFEMGVHAAAEGDAVGKGFKRGDDELVTVEVSGVQIDAPFSFARKGFL